MLGMIARRATSSSLHRVLRSTARNSSLLPFRGLRRQIRATVRDRYHRLLPVGAMDPRHDPWSRPRCPYIASNSKTEFAVNCDLSDHTFDFLLGPQRELGLAFREEAGSSQVHSQLIEPSLVKRQRQDWRFTYFYLAIVHKGGAFDNSIVCFRKSSV